MNDQQIISILNLRNKEIDLVLLYFRVFPNDLALIFKHAFNFIEWLNNMTFDLTSAGMTT